MARRPRTRARSAAERNASVTAAAVDLGSHGDIFIGDDHYANEQRLLRLPTIEAQLAAWIRGYEQGKVSNCGHLRRSGFSLYVRHSLHLIDDKELMALDIASIQAPEKFRGRGWFRSFRQIAEALNPWHATYYEMVHNERLAVHLQSAGYMNDVWRCYYKLHGVPTGR